MTSLLWGVAKASDQKGDLGHSVIQHLSARRINMSGPCYWNVLRVLGCLSSIGYLTHRDIPQFYGLSCPQRIFYITRMLLFHYGTSLASKGFPSGPSKRVCPHPLRKLRTYEAVFAKRRLTNTPRRHRLADGHISPLHSLPPRFSSFGAYKYKYRLRQVRP